MPTYEFQDVKNGAVVELYMPMSEAPRIGHSIREGKRKLRRIASVPEGKVQPDCRHVSNLIPTKHLKHAPRPDVGGAVTFHNRREIREFEAKSGLKYEH